MSLHQAFGSEFRHIFSSHFILSNLSLILACLASGCLWILSWTRVTSGSKLKVKGPPKLFQPVCISGSALRTHSSVIVALRDGKGMFGCQKIKYVWCKYRFRWQRDVSGVRDLCCWQLFWGYRMGVWKCSGNMWCSMSMDFICRDLNPYRLCTVWDRREKWLVFYPYVWAKSFHGWIRLLCCGWDACFWSSALEGSTTKQFHPVVCCMWRQYLTAAWLICLCPSSKGLDNYALGPRLLDFMCCRQFGHIFLVWYQLQRDRFHTFPLNWHQDGVPGVWCLRVWCIGGYG